MADDHNSQAIQKPIRAQALAAVRQFESEELSKVSSDETLKKQIVVSPFGGYYVQFSPDGRHLAAENGRMIRLWDWQQGRITRLIKGESGVINSFAFLPDNHRMLVAETFQVVLWDLDDDCVIWQRKLPPRSRPFVHIDLRLMPDGISYLTTYSGESSIWRFDDEGYGKWLNTKRGSVTETVITPDQHWMAYARLWGSEVNLKEIQAQHWEEIELRYHNAPVKALALTPDGMTLISGGEDGLICLWDLAEKKLKQVLMGHSGRINALAVSGDGRHLFSGGKDRNLRMWDLQTGHCVQTFFHPQGEVKSITVSPDGTFAAAGCWGDPAVYVWDLASGALRQRLDKFSLSVKALRGTSEGFWAADADRYANSLHLAWFDRAGHSQHRRTPAVSQRLLNTVAISPDGALLAAGGYRSVGLYDMQQGRMIHRLTGYKDYVKSLAFSPDGRRLISGTASIDEHLRIYDTQSGQCLHRIPVDSKQQIGMYAIACHPDGHRFLVSGISGISLWDLAAGRFIREVLPISERRLSAALAVHPDGQQFAVGVRESAIVLYDLAAGEQRQTFTGHTDEITALAFSPDGRLLYASDSGALIRVWEVESGTCLAVVYNLEEGYLWTTPPEESAPDGWLHTDRPDLILLRIEKESGGKVEHISEKDARFQDYLRLYNDQDMVMKRIYDRKRYDHLRLLRSSSQSGAAGQGLLGGTVSKRLPSGERKDQER